MKAQLRFAMQMAKNNNSLGTNSKSLPLKNSHEKLAISEEMISWINTTVKATDEDGYLSEQTASALSAPLDSYSTFCPIGSLISSKYTAPRAPSPVKSDTYRSNKSELFTNISLDSSTSSSISNNPSKPSKDFTASVNRLNVLWLKRRSHLEREEGSLNESIKTLQEAIDLHLDDELNDHRKLTDDTTTNNPLEMLTQIKSDFFLYDDTTHRLADKLQRWYHRFYKKKCQSASRIKTCFRNYLRKRRNWKFQQLRTQCAKLVQRRFRVHLKRMHMLASKIKGWFKIRKAVKAYQRLLRIYRKVRQIQKVYRGVVGRRIAAKARHRWECAKMIQRNVRGFILRRLRAFAIQQFHRVFYKAAIKIQCMIRRVLSIGRMKSRLLEELQRERQRMFRENAVLKQAIDNEIARVKLYMKTGAGKLHLARNRDKICVQDEEFEKLKPSLSENEIMTREALIMFELFDNDGSGSIDREELNLMLRELCISMSSEEVERLADELDLDGSGDIDFSEFVEWYAGGSTNKSSSLGGAMFRQVLKARRAILDLSGQTLARRTERSVLRQCCSWLSSETRTLFRMHNAPKYNCCRCLTPFVLFSEYYNHFKGPDRICVATGERGMFYEKFWRQDEWLKQRQIEVELMRVRDEYPCLSYNAMMAVFKELSLQQHSGVADILNVQIDAATEMLFDQLLNDITEETTSFLNLEYKKSLVDRIYDIANICDDGFLSPNVAFCISDCLRETLPNDWIINDSWSLDTFKTWLSGIEKLQRPVPPPKRCVCCKSLLARRYNRYVKQDANLLGSIMVRCIRLLQVGAETSLVTLAAYRKKRPRRVAISDKELMVRGLNQITLTRYNEVNFHLIKRLEIIKNTLRRLYILSINIRKRQNALTWKTKLITKLKNKCGFGYAPIHLDEEEPSEEEMKAFEIADAHSRAYAFFKSRLNTRVGKMHVTRASYELWAHKQDLLDTHQASLAPLETFFDSMNLKAKLKYLFKLHSMSGDDTMAVEEFESLAKDYLCLKLTQEQVIMIVQELDPQKTGRIHLNDLEEWILLKKYEGYVDQMLLYRFHAKQLSLQTDAKTQILSNIRIMSRLDLEVQKDSLKSICQVTDGLLNKQVKKVRSKNMKMMTDEMEAMEERQSRLLGLKKSFEANEQEVITRMKEDDAEFDCNFYLFLKSRGRHFLNVESLIMKHATKVMGCYNNFHQQFGTPGTPGKAAPMSTDQCSELSLEVLVNCFDTDCSGTFDEGELKFLLKCLKMSLPEKNLLYHFPGLLVDRSTSVDSVIQYLVDHLMDAGKYNPYAQLLIALQDHGWSQVGINMKSRLAIAQSMLLSLARQDARKKAEEAASLTSTGQLVQEDDRPGSIENKKGLLKRCQIFALRQTELFLSTHFGKTKYAMITRILRYYWDRLNLHTEEFTKVKLIDYVFEVFKNVSNVSTGECQILNTELPFIREYISKRFHEYVEVKQDSSIKKYMACLSHPGHLSWLSREEFFDLMNTILLFHYDGQGHGHGGLALLGNGTLIFQKHVDTQTRLEAEARQQAIMIAFDLPEKQVKETNYRCFILGLEFFLKFFAKEMKHDIVQDWSMVPEECMILYLLSHGFTYDDVVSVSYVEALDDVEEKEDKVLSSLDAVGRGILVDPELLLQTSIQRVFTKLKCTSSMMRLGLYAMGGFKYTYFQQVAKALLFHRDHINELGRMFLNEMILGVSHSAFE